MSSPPKSSQLEKMQDARLREQLVSRQLQKPLATIQGVGLYQTDDAVKFHISIEAAKNDGKQEDIDSGKFGTIHSKWNGAYVHTYPVDDYKEMDMLLTEDSKAGVAIKGDEDIVSVFKHPKSTVRNLVDTLLPEAIKRGGNRLDCFNGVLPILYSKHGLVPVAKVEFNQDFAPEDWNYARDGKPDIIFMAYGPNVKIEEDPAVRKEIIKKIIDGLPHSTYDEASNMQKAFLLNSKK